MSEFTMYEKIVTFVGVIIIFSILTFLATKHETHYGKVSNTVVCDGEYCVDIMYDDGNGGISGVKNDLGLVKDDLVTVKKGLYWSKVKLR